MGTDAGKTSGESPAGRLRSGGVSGEGQHESRRGSGRAAMIDDRGNDPPGLRRSDPGAGGLRAGNQRKGVAPAGTGARPVNELRALKGGDTQPCQPDRTGQAGGGIPDARSARVSVGSAGSVRRTLIHGCYLDSARLRPRRRRLWRRRDHSGMAAAPPPVAEPPLVQEKGRPEFDQVCRSQPGTRTVVANGRHV